MSADPVGKYLVDNLVGKTITGVVQTPFEGNVSLYGLIVRAPGAKKDQVAWILCDPEGNGPGHLDVQEDT